MLTLALAEQDALDPPLSPEHCQLYGPVPVTEDAVPDKHRFVLGGLEKDMPELLPQTPFINTAVAEKLTEQFVLILPVVYVLPLQAPRVQVPPTVLNRE